MALYHDIDINKLQNDGLLKIAYTEEFYLSFNQKDNKINTVTVDNDKVHRKELRDCEYLLCLIVSLNMV
jgi:hypothetical protein